MHERPVSACTRAPLPTVLILGRFIRPSPAGSRLFSLHELCKSMWHRWIDGHNRAGEHNVAVDRKRLSLQPQYRDDSIVPDPDYVYPDYGPLITPNGGWRRYVHDLTEFLLLISPSHEAKEREQKARREARYSSLESMWTNPDISQYPPPSAKRVFSSFATAQFTPILSPASFTRSLSSFSFSSSGSHLEPRTSPLARPSERQLPLSPSGRRRNVLSAGARPQSRIHERSPTADEAGVVSKVQETRQTASAAQSEAEGRASSGDVSSSEETTRPLEMRSKLKNDDSLLRSVLSEGKPVFRL
jgi:hypothetical protein